MKKLITSLLTLTFLASCGKNETEYLYDKYDGQDFQAVLAAQQKECETKNKIFKALDETSKFSNFFAEKNVRIFKITRKYSKKNNSSEEEGVTAQETHVVYAVMRKEGLVGNDLEVNITHTSADPMSLEFKNKKIIWEQEDNKKLLDTAISGFCSGKYKGSVGTDAFVIDSNRKDIISTEPEVFTKRAETLTFLRGRPAFLYRWNGTIEFQDKNTLNDTTETWKAPDGIQELTEQQCKAAGEPDECELALTSSSLPTCDLDVNETHPSSKNPNEFLTSFSGC
jgi:hypothetical protein